MNLVQIMNALNNGLEIVLMYSEDAILSILREQTRQKRDYVRAMSRNICIVLIKSDVDDRTNILWSFGLQAVDDIT